MFPLFLITAAKYSKLKLLSKSSFTPGMIYIYIQGFFEVYCIYASTIDAFR
ncbi:MAG: hypothetical protein UV61_C0014G0019 [Candidatus Gottesmanbacteria bacterium GW2011_GWB1_43_11]|uniref:Uncharacterized protein n=1 Tax=Candidatus Gottesmanbacteria bacterium GW2011_GWB1_43_11 TaxID=1618446 RepID=A0A0G1CK95_9BACT|nr:MAG: hypothetical protein UV04_C0041G0005 [Candidatus Gottesmanbacteria bacterium GW2011_GWA2_42_16]KKS53133.1 MAG: hypothetical protein UV17_C0040G0013 [Candidatus Gottesmanbacteria bacterium GW2011_GWA1_42_26]KKS81692.1 MAG: hypothetical protein UV55_C0010G0021 [Candidatus Gottesmanbacteria bacterium GW2011_GWC1_43_10]KKS85919.1 MAG: hypothetical protein UV61_C0014G0019 [Candidatus Gottesmanbacteria bacterium GW2011_GWB1_43_11]